MEGHDSPESAIRREKQIKEWRRSWKIKMIEANNPHWIDLYRDISP
jgi:putative endonuclease